MVTTLILQQDYNGLKEGKLVDVDSDDAQYLISEGVARHATDKDYDDNDNNDEATILIAQRAAEMVKKEIGTKAQRPPFFDEGIYAKEGYGSIDPKKFWCGDIPTGSNFGNAAEFLKAVSGANKGAWDNRLSNKDITGSNQAEGGFLVPTEMASFIYQSMLEDSPFMSQCTLLPMNHSTIKVPYVYDADHSTGIHGTAIPHAVGEGAALTDISSTFGECEFSLHKIAGRSRVSNEMLEDSAYAMSTLLPKIFADKVGWEMTRQIISGTGAGECLGILNSAALVSQTKETGQAADTIVAKNIIKMWSRLLPAAQRKAVWLANLDTIPQLLTMSIAVGTGGSIVYLVGKSLENAAPTSILGRPLYFLEQMPTVGDAGDIIACNLEAYAIGKKPGDSIRIESSREVRFENDQTVFRAITRLDGQSLQSVAITPASGSANTLSNFVTLAART